MKRELAFALGARSQILHSAGKTRSNRALNAPSNGVSASRSRKRVKGASCEEPVAFDCSITEVKESGISSSICDELKKDLVDKVIECQNVGFGDLAGHCEDAEVEDGQMAVSRLENGLAEKMCGTEVETMAVDEPVAVDNSVHQVKEPENRVNGCLEVEGNRIQDNPVLVERKDSESGLVEKTCEKVELETAVVCEEQANTTNRSKGELQDHCNGNLNLDNGLVAPQKSGALEKTPETEIGNSSKIERSLVVEEVTSPDENLKTYAERPQRRFTRSVLRDNNKDNVDGLNMETNITSTASEENPVAVNLKHSSEVILDTCTAEPHENRDADGNRSESQNKIEMEISKPVLITKVPVTVRELFETGILEGCPVFYNGGKKGPGMRGVIKGLGILCSCELCQGCKVVPPSQFEIHACNTYKRAAQYICLENGRSFIDILQLCRRTKLKGVQETLQNAVGPLPPKQLVVCKNCKESYSTSNVADRDPMCNSCTIKMYPTQKQLGAAVKSSRSPTCPSTSKPSGATSVLNTVRGRNSGIDRSPKPISTLKSIEETSLSRSLRKRSSETHRLPVKGLKMSKSSRAVQMAKVSVGKAKASRKIRKSTKAVSISKKSLRGQGKIKRSKKPIGESTKKAGKITKKWSRRKLAYREVSRQHLLSRGSHRPQPPCLSRQGDLSMHRLVFGEAGLPDGSELAYFARGKRLLDGYKKDSGIFCRCCSEVVSASQFEAHAGFAMRRKPYSHIYTSNGVSLHELAVTLLQSSKRDLKGNDDLCVMCAEGGKLLLCDSCPRAFHLECANLSDQPHGSWFCRYCKNAFERDSYVGRNANAIAAGRVSGVDAMVQISNLSIRIVKDFQEDATSCYLCRSSEFSKSGFGPLTIILCDQCEREYHVGCLKTHKMADLKKLPEGDWFCRTSCQSIRSSLQDLSSQGVQKLPSTLADVIKRKHVAQNAEISADFEVSWRLLSGQVSSAERAKTRTLFSQASAILHAGFGSIVEGPKARDIIPSIVYGRKVGVREFRGMYCSVLMVNSLVVSVAVFRLFGQELAELPLVATRDGYRGKGFFEALFGCIERFFASHNVKKIVLPAAEGTEGLWLKFGFQGMTPEQLSNYKKVFWQLTEFTGVTMLEKEVPDYGDEATENAPEAGDCA